MNLAALAQLIRLKPALPETDRPRWPGATDAAGPSLLAREARPVRFGAPAAPAAVTPQTLLVGLDFGAAHTRVAAVVPGVEGHYLRRSLPSAVARLLPEDGKTVSPYLHFGADALGRDGRFQTIHPWQAGDLADPAMARELARHVRDLMRRSDQLCCRAVVAEPVTLDAQGRHHFQEALRGLFEQVVFLPRPYLAGLGLRTLPAWEPAASGQPALLVDLGAGSTEFCRLGETYPRPGDMAAVAFGADHVTTLVREGLRLEYPAFQPARGQVRHWVENFGFVGEPPSTVVVNVTVDGVERQIVLTQALRRGCEAWLAQIRERLQSWLTQAASRGMRPATVHLAGGGSRLNRLAPVLAQRLAQAGFEDVAVRLVEETDLSLAALGALHAAQRVRDDQWPRFALR